MGYSAKKSEYRRAKKFRLQHEDNEYFVADEFTGTAKAAIKDFGYYGNPINLYGKYNIHRYLESRVGDNWNTVYSDICEIANNTKSYNRDFILEQIGWNVVTNVVIVDGAPWSIGDWRSMELRNGALYINDGVLCKYRKKRVKRKYVPGNDVEDKDGYFLKKNEGNGRITTYVWLRSVTKKQIVMEDRYVRYTSSGSRIVSWYYHKDSTKIKEAIEHITTKNCTVSKKEIRDNKLNERL